MKAGFQVWMNDVDSRVKQSAGLSVHDLPDCCFADWFESGVKPQAAAKRAIKAAKSEF